MAKLSNGDVIPSHIEIGYAPTYDGGDFYNNTALRFGEVQEIVYPNDKKSRSKKFVEYRVYVQERSNGTGNGRIYENAILINDFSSLADKSFFTLRADSTATTSETNNKQRVGLGAKVLILCINGETNNPVIIGGLRDSKDDSEKDFKKDDPGHHLSKIFNGISLLVNKDGELTVTYNGKTGNDGKTDSGVDSGTVGTSISFLKDGTWNAHTPKKAKFKADDGVHLNDATDFMLLGESFRNSQKSMNNSIKQQAQQMQQFLQQAGQQLNQAGGKVVGAFLSAAAGPLLIIAGQLISQAAQSAGQIADAINSFENDASGKNSFISKLHKLD